MVTKVWGRSLPLGKRWAGNNPKGPTTDAPRSKWTGEPITRLAGLDSVKGYGVRGHDPRRRPPGFFEEAVSELPLIKSQAEAVRLKARNRVDNRVRRAILQAARPVVLAWNKPGGLDRIRGPKLNPRLPALVPEALPGIVPIRWRGTQGAALSAPADRLRALAVAGNRVDMAAAAGAGRWQRSRLPIGLGFETVSTR